MRRLFVSCVVLAACASSPAPDPAPAQPDEQPSTNPPATDTAPEAAADPAPAAVVQTEEASQAPLEVPAEINQRYREQNDPKQWEERFEQEGREVHDRLADIVAALDPQPGDAIADVGAGSGMFTMAFAKNVSSKGSVVAVDVQPYFLEHIKTRAKNEGLDNVRATLATQTSVSLDADSVDLVFMCDAYHHIEHPTPYLKSIREALRSGGRLVVIDYDRTAKGTKRWMKKHIRADPQEFAAEIEAAGFKRTASLDLLKENFFFVFEAS